MSFEILVQPNSDPLTLSEVKSYLRIGTDGDDQTLNIMLKAAVESVEKQTFQAIISRKLRQNFNLAEIENAISFANKMGGKPSLRPILSPISAIDSIKTLGNDGSYINAPNGLIKLEDNKFTIDGFSVGLQIEYWAGFTSNNLVPISIKLMILEEIAKSIAYQNNEKFEAISNPNDNGIIRL